ncbi:hypothetical protein RF11_05639 [Thelohanellus kitauei]|uniref:VWFC domain-containing protein n=1 Tax=Thelohanellus kitauei TaxID=669202 RepID=A0A0C2IAW9_THEKT|nr:hypothetical protein RF11_05639 [Thelohanellus kitauei]
MILKIISFFLIFPVIYNDCIDEHGVKYQVGEFMRPKNISKCELCQCGDDSRLKCGIYSSCQTLNCKLNNSVVRDCCMELKCGGIHTYVILAVSILVMSCILIAVVIILLFVSWCRLRRSSQSADHNDDISDIYFTEDLTSIECEEISETPSPCTSKPQNPLMLGPALFY